jgi:hypothetical protein
MDSDYNQHIRSKLQKRLKRLNGASRQSFHSVLAQTWEFLHSNEITKGILADLEKRIPMEAKPWAETILKNEGRVLGGTELDNDGICYWVVKITASTPFSQSTDEHGYPLVELLETISDELEPFREEYVEHFFDYMDEQIDDKRMTLSLLKKYKHRYEWFCKGQLFEACKADTKQGEKILAYNLYEYLHDQGLQFHIEPQSDSGRVDLILAQSGQDRLVADTKIFNPGGGQNPTYIIKRFRQVFDYTRDFNEAFGYLVIFKTCEQDLSIPTQNQESSIPFITHNNKSILIVVIDIFPYDESASKRGQLKSHEILPSQFVESLTEVEPQKE